MKNQKRDFFIMFVLFAIGIMIRGALGFLVLGLLFLYNFVKAFLFIRAIERRGVECMGTIVSFNSERDPVVEYTTTEGAVISGEPFMSTSTEISGISLNQASSGRVLKISYNPENPEQFLVLNDMNSHKEGVAIFCLIGLGMIVLSICGLLGCIEIEGL